MKKAFILILISAALAFGAAGCGGNGPKGQPSQTTSQPSQTAVKTAEATPSAAESPAYEFEFEDINGKVHRLSDYKGKPVYLEVWGTWCGVCVSSLPDLDEFAGEEHDFAVLSVVFPGTAGEKSKEDFIEWFKALGHNSLTVLLDEKSQILSDFGIRAFPTSIVFDSGGVPVTGFAGLMPQENIVEIMKQVAEGTFRS